MILNTHEVDSLETRLAAYVRETRAVRLITDSWAEHGHEQTIANMGDIVAQLTPEELSGVGASRSIAGLSELDVFLTENPQLFIPLGFSVRSTLQQNTNSVGATRSNLASDHDRNLQSARDQRT